MADAAPSLSGETICSEKERLLRAYGFASGDYHRTIMVLTERIGIMPKADYDRIRDYIENARTVLEAAREALDRHTVEHGC
jgi:hypothetical protein